ncbi:hypothetical protein ACFQ2T_04935 [Methylophilus flavus]|uniref:Uncharacterized protein n=1 Tax=Methylophilus flavus TaxID=640084 RepID=A0ABW3P9Y1_9PROT
MPNIHIVRENSLNLNRGIYADWMGNALSDGNANTLLVEGSAVLVNYKNAYLNEALSAAQIANGNINGVAGVGDGILYDENGEEIVVATDPSSKVANSLSASDKFIDVTQRHYAFQDNTATTAAFRICYQNENRDGITIINPPTNTVTLRIGLKDSDNVLDANGSFSVFETVAPGEQLDLPYERRQVFLKQAQNGVVADQYAVVTERFSL